jgi:hypothetical protein
MRILRFGFILEAENASPISQKNKEMGCLKLSFSALLYVREHKLKPLFDAHGDQLVWSFLEFLRWKMSTTPMRFLATSHIKQYSCQPLMASSC